MPKTTKPFTELEPGQRYSETYDCDEVYTLIAVTDAQDADRIRVDYLDADKVISRTNAPRTAHVFPFGPAPSAIKAAMDQLQKELEHPAMQAAIMRGLDED